MKYERGIGLPDCTDQGLKLRKYGISLPYSSIDGASLNFRISQPGVIPKAGVLHSRLRDLPLEDFEGRRSPLRL